MTKLIDSAIKALSGGDIDTYEQLLSDMTDVDLEILSKGVALSKPSVAASRLKLNLTSLSVEIKQAIEFTSFILPVCGVAVLAFSAVNLAEKLPAWASAPIGGGMALAIYSSLVIGDKASNRVSRFLDSDGK